MTIFYVAFGLLAIGLIIFIHEAGHFLAAKKVGVRVDRFALGFDPLIKGRYLRFFSRKWGETEYVIGMIPFGGYVKLAGEIPEEDGKPLADDELLAKSIGARALVFVAGAVMNFLSAFVFFMIAFAVGVGFPEPYVGEVQAGGPGWTAGLRTGDEVLDIDGETVDDYTQVLLAGALAGPDEILHFKIRRTPPSGDEPTTFDVDVKTQWSPALGMSTLGIGPSGGLELAATPPEGSAAAKAGLLEGESIVGLEVNGAELPPIDERARYLVLQKRLLFHPTSPLRIKIRHSNGTESWTTLELEGAEETGDRAMISVLRGLPGQSGTIVGKIAPDARIQQGKSTGLDEFLDPHDRVLAVEGARVIHMKWHEVARAGDGPTVRLDVRALGGETREVHIPREKLVRGLLDGKVFWTANNARVAAVDQSSPLAKAGLQENDILEAIANTPVYEPEDVPGAVSEQKGETLAVQILRGTEIVRLDIPRTALETAKGVTWSSFAPLLAVDPEGPAGQAGIEVGARITKLADSTIHDFQDVAKALKDLEDGDTVTVEWLTAGGDKKSSPVTLASRAFKRSGLAFKKREVVIQESILKSFQLGIERSVIVVEQVFLTLRSLIRRDVEAKNLSGPIGITHLFTRVAEMGWVKLLFWMAIVSVNLGVLNLLPFPILDGGHLLFLLIEKIKGSPVSFGVQEWATRIAFLAIISLALFVTYHDVARLLFG